MPSKSRFKKTTDNSIFGKIIESSIEDSSKLLNAVDFIESPQGLNVHLYPLQRLTVKCIFGVPLDYKPVKVPMWDVFRENLIREVSEEECLHILYEEGRCNLNDWRDLPKRGVNEAVIFAGRRAGKMLSVDTPIPTPTGFVRNGDLKEGDDIFGEDGKVYKVKYAHPIQEEEAYKVSFDDGTFVYAHGGHLWHTYTRNERKGLYRRIVPVELPKVEIGFCQCGCGEYAPVSSRSSRKRGVNKGDTLPFVRGHHLRRPRYSPPITGGIRTTEEIFKTLQVVSNRKKPMQANHTIPLPQPMELPEQLLPLNPYTLGLWLGDGSKITSAITTNDKEIVEHWYNLAESYGLHINTSPKKGTTCCTYRATTGKAVPGCTRLGRNPIVNILREMDVLSNKHIPERYLWASKSQREELLRGLMDSDGYVASDGGASFSNTNRSLTEGVYHLAASLGLKPYWIEDRATLYGKDCGANYTVSWTSTFPVCSLKRKADRIKKTTKTTQNWRYITNIESAGKMQMRCITTTNPTGLYLFGKNFNVTHNSEVVAAVGAYKLYQLLSVRNPQEYFGLLSSGSHIDFTFLAHDEDGAGRLYDKLREDVNRAPFFNPYLKDSSGSWMGFVSDADRLKRDIIPSINVESFSCTTSSSRGPSNIFLALDEFSHFRSEKGSSSTEVYEAATPSTINFKHAELLDGGWVPQSSLINFAHDQYKMYQDSLILSISSPWLKTGKMYDLHKLAMETGIDSGIFTIRVSTAEMNPTILPQTLHKEHAKNPLTFKAEYGGQFLESSETFATESQIRNCTDVVYISNPKTGTEEPDLTTARYNLTQFKPDALGRKYFWFIDLGMVKDATGVAIAHLEYRGGTHPVMLIYDYIDRMMVGEKFEGIGVQQIPGVEKYVNHKALPLEDILSWFKALNDLMPCYRGGTDQHGGQQLIQLLELNRIHNIELINLSNTINSQMAFVLQGYIRDERCRFPYVPKFMHELRMVEAELRNKYQMSVEAPNEKGAHDDMVDSASGCAYIAQKWLVEEGRLDLDPTGQSILMSERMHQPSVAIANLDAVPMRELQIMERLRNIQQMASAGTEVVRNPFNRRGFRR